MIAMAAPSVAYSMESDTCMVGGNNNSGKNLACCLDVSRFWASDADRANNVTSWPLLASNMANVVPQLVVPVTTIFDMFNNPGQEERVDGSCVFMRFPNLFSSPFISRLMFSL